MKYLGILTLVPAWFLCVSFATAASLSDQPAHFYQDAAGNWYGETVSGQSFSQKNIPNDAGIRLQRFVLGDISYFITDQGVIWADSNLHAISIYFARRA
jgi:hypothetical protein